MIYPRVGFDAVLLGSGSVLAVGDDHACLPGGALPGSERAELYDPAKDAWVEVESLGAARKTFATVVLPDGSAMVIGGDSSADSSISSTSIFGPAKHSWSDGPALTAALVEPFAVSTGDGRVLVVGRPEASGQIYDPHAPGWHLLGTFPGAIDVTNLLALHDGRVLMLGVPEGASTQAGYLYDPVRGSWAAVDGPSAFAGYTLVALSDAGALAIGGLKTADGSAARDVRRFDPASRHWTQAASMSTGRLGAQVVVLGDGRVLVAGGATALEPRLAKALQTAEVYDPAADRWASAGALLTPRMDGYAVALADGSALVLGGAANFDTNYATPFCPSALASVERFWPSPPT